MVLEKEIFFPQRKIARLAVLEDQITSFQEEIAANEQEKRTLQKRVDHTEHMGFIDCLQVFGHAVFLWSFPALERRPTGGITCRKIDGER